MPQAALVMASRPCHDGPVRDARFSCRWHCLGRRDGNNDQPVCYENLITCVMAALTHASWCTWRPQLTASVDAMNRRAAVAPVSRRRTHAALGQHKFSAAERDELYREFQKLAGAVNAAIENVAGLKRL